MQPKLLLPALLFLNTFVHAGKLPKTDVPGKIYFSNQPMLSSNAGSKNVFSSAEYIYARLELNGTTIKDAFKIKEPGKGYPFLQCRVSIIKDGYEFGGGGRNYLLLKDDQRGSSSLSFDVLPEPSRATTVFSLVDDFSAGIGFYPFYNTIINERLAEGKYTVKVKLYVETQDSWGTYQPKEKWPTIEEEFEFEFRDEDVARILSNNDQIVDIIRENAFRYDKLPAVFSNPAVIADPKATNAKIAAILKRDLPHRTILKFAVEKTSGILWHIATDDFNLPKYRYFNPDIYVAYKLEDKCYVGTVTLREVYSGGGTYGPLQVAFTSASSEQDKGIDCTKIK
ncbi:MAG: hypothetical protein ACRDEB_01410 [Chitinophagaceae bacterium]